MLLYVPCYITTCATRILHTQFLSFKRHEYRIKYFIQSRDKKYMRSDKLHLTQNKKSTKSKKCRIVTTLCLSGIYLCDYFYLNTYLLYVQLFKYYSLYMRKRNVIFDNDVQRFLKPLTMAS